MTEKLVQLQRRLAGLDLELPPKMAGLLETWRAVNEVKVEDPLTDLRVALAAGDLDAKTARKLVKASIAGYAEQKYGPEIARDLSNSFRQGEQAVMRPEALDDLIVSVRPEFDGALATLAETIPFIGANPDKHTIHGTASLTLFGRWEEAVARLGKVRQLVNMFTGWNYGTDVRPDVLMYLAAATTPADIDTANRLFFERDGFSALVDAGIGLRLNTATEARAIVASIEATLAAEAAELDQRQAEAARTQGEAEVAAIRDGRIIPPEARHTMTGRVQPVA